MSIKKDCNNCGKKFDAKRANSLYCSDSCKTQAYQKRAAKKVAELEPKEKLTFYLDEYENVRPKANEWTFDPKTEAYYNDLDMPVFCFLRNMYPKKSTIQNEKLAKYLESFVDGTQLGGFSRVRNSEAFKEFEKRFFNNEFELAESNNSECLTEELN